MRSRSQAKGRRTAPGRDDGRFRAVVEAAPFGMHFYRLEPDGRLIFAGANPAADRILHVRNADFVGKTIEEAFPPLARTEVPERYRRAARDGIPWHTEQVTYRDGQIAGAYEVYAFQTAPGEMAAAFQDILERRRAADELERELESARTELLVARNEVEGARGEVDARTGELQKRIAELEAQSAKNEERVLKAYQKIKGDEKVKDKVRKAIAIAAQLLEEGLPAEPAPSTPEKPRLS